MDKPNAGPGAPLRKEVTGSTVHQRGKREIASLPFTHVPVEYLLDTSSDWNSKALGKKKGSTYVAVYGSGECKLAVATGPERDDPWTFMIEDAPEDGVEYSRKDGEWVPTTFFDYALYSMSITHPDPSLTIAVTGTGEQELEPPTGYQTILNAYSETMNRGDGVFTELANGTVQVNKTGLYKIDGYIDVSHSATFSSHVGIVFQFDIPGVGMVFSPRSVHARIPNFGDIGNICGNGVVQLVEDSIISIAVASENTGNVTVYASTVTVQYLGDLP